MSVQWYSSSAACAASCGYVEVDFDGSTLKYRSQCISPCQPPHFSPAEEAQIMASMRAANVSKAIVCCDHATNANHS